MTFFEIITVLLSFVYALALSHLLQSASDLWVARDRVRFSLRLALWMLVSTLLLAGNWLALTPLAKGEWGPALTFANFLMAVTQYFTCSLASMRVRDDGPVDMVAHEDQQRRSIMVAYLGLVFWALLLNAVQYKQWTGQDFAWLPFLSYCWPEVLFGAAVILCWWRRERWLHIGVAGVYSLFLLTQMLGL